MLEIWGYRMISLTNLLVMDENAEQMTYGVCFLTNIFSVFSPSHMNLLCTI